MAHVATVTIQSSQVPAALTDYRVYIDLSDLPASFWDVVANGGGDIRCFKDDGTTELAREVVSCNTATDTGELHVLYSGTLSNTVDTEIQIHADGVSSDYAVTATYGRNAVFNASIAAVGEVDVFHLESNGTNSLGSGDATESASVTYAAGKLGNGADLTGEYFNTSNGWNGSSGSIRIWASIDSAAQNYGIGPYVSDGTDSTGNGFGDSAIGGVLEKHIGYVASDAAFSFTYQDGEDNLPGSGLKRMTGTTAPSAGTLYFIAATWDESGTAKLYVNGVEEGSETISGLTFAGKTPTTYRLSNVGEIAANREQDGTLDESRVRAVQLSADWISTEYTNQNTPNTFYTVTAAGVTVAPDGISHSQTIGNITLTQGNVLALQSMSHGATIDNLTLTQAHTLAADSLTHSQTIDNATLTQANAIVPNSITQGQSPDAVTLAQAHVLVPAGMTQGQSIDAVSITQANVLAPAGVTQGQSIGSATLTVAGVLAIDSLSQAQTIDQALLTVAGVLSLDGITQAQTLEALELVQNHVLAPNGITQGQSVDSITLSAAQALALDGLTQSQTVATQTLTQYHVLAVDSLTQAQAIDVCLLGGLVIGELQGKIVIYAALGGTVYAIPALSGTIH